jgi:hypothetical protein
LGFHVIVFEDLVHERQDIELPEPDELVLRCRWLRHDVAEGGGTSRQLASYQSDAPIE